MRRGLGASRRGRPSLLGSVARTAVIAGTATSVAGRVSANQQQAIAQQQQGQQAQQQLAAIQQQQHVDAQVAAALAQQGPATAPASAPPASSTDDLISQLTKLAALKDAGVLTDDEFAAQKARILA